MTSFAHFSPPHQDLSTLPSHLFQPLGMMLSTARDSNETLVDPAMEVSTSVDPFNSFTTSVPSPSTRFIVQLDAINGNLEIVDSASVSTKYRIERGTEPASEGESERWSIFEGDAALATLTEEALISKDGTEVKWSRFYKTGWFSRQRTWLDVDGNCRSWEEPARHAKPSELKLLDVATKDVVASVRLGTNGEPQALAVADAALSSLHLIIITFLHRLYAKAIIERREERERVQSEQEEDMMAW